MSFNFVDDEVLICKMKGNDLPSSERTSASGLLVGAVLT
jgi:hypothetical protein